MINIANVTRQMLWASALVMAATGEARAQAPLEEASASAPIAVITQTGLPYFASPQAVNSKPLGQFAFNTHVCVTGKVYTWNRLQFLQYVLPSGALVYTLAGKGILAHDPAGDKSCRSKVASTTLPANIPPPVQPAPQPAPTPPTMAATGEASGQMSGAEQLGWQTTNLKGPFAMIAKGPVPYYNSDHLGHVADLEHVATAATPPLGHFAANQHLCANWKETFQNAREFVNVGGSGALHDGSVIAIYSREAFIPDPANDQKCLDQAKTAAASPDIAPSINNGVDDPSMRADIADIAEFLLSDHTPVGETMGFEVKGGIKGAYNLIKNDPDAKNIDTKSAIAEGFYFRGGRPNDGWIYDDKKFSDLQRARLWYQMALAQIRTEYPDISPDVRTCANHYPCPSDPHGVLRSLINGIENRLAFCPTSLRRQQQRAAAEKEQRDEAVRQEEAAKENAKEERDPAAGKSDAQNWSYNEPTDQLTGKKTYNATRTFPFTGGKAEMTAFCEASLLGGGFSIKIVFFDNHGHPINVDTNGFVSSQYGTNGTFRYIDGDGEYPIAVQIPHTNEIKLPLFNAVISHDTLKAFLASSFAKVEVLLTAGTVIIDLQPKDLALRKVLGYCLYPNHLPQGLQ
jgi:hypothetical protein